MNTPVSTASTVPAQLHPNKAALFKAIGSPLRCEMLAEMSSGEPRMVVELARRTGITPAMASKHLALLRRAGLIELSRRNYQIPRHFLAGVDPGHVDYGHVLLRLTGTTAQPTA
jgi:DNA-binding transcriptional ArsR family regulator